MRLQVWRLNGCPGFLVTRCSSTRLAIPVAGPNPSITGRHKGKSQPWKLEIDEQEAAEEQNEVRKTAALGDRCSE